MLSANYQENVILAVLGTDEITSRLATYKDRHIRKIN